MSSLIDTLKTATPADLDAIDAEIATLTRLREVVALLVGKGVETYTIPAAQAVRTKTAAQSQEEKQRRLLRALANGPLRRTDLPKASGLTPEGVQNCLNGPWFEKVSPGGHMDPWQLTEAGRAALATSMCGDRRREAKARLQSPQAETSRRSDRRPPADRGPPARARGGVRGDGRRGARADTRCVVEGRRIVPVVRDLRQGLGIDGAGKG